MKQDYLLNASKRTNGDDINNIGIIPTLSQIPFEADIYEEMVHMNLNINRLR